MEAAAQILRGCLQQVALNSCTLDPGNWIWLGMLEKQSFWNVHVSKFARQLLKSIQTALKMHTVLIQSNCSDKLILYQILHTEHKEIYFWGIYIITVLWPCIKIYIIFWSEHDWKREKVGLSFSSSSSKGSFFKRFVCKCSMSVKSRTESSGCYWLFKTIIPIPKLDIEESVD